MALLLSLLAGAEGGPHIILSMADDLGYYDTEVSNWRVHSPTLKMMADNGVVLSRHYMHRFCSPSRSMTLAGIDPYRHGQQTDMNLNPIGTTPCALQESIDLLPAELQRAGYKTHMIGKWHLGHYRPDTTPTERGFDTFVGFYAGGTGPMTRTVDKWGMDTELLHEKRCTCEPDNGDSLAVERVSCDAGGRKYCATEFQLMNSTRSHGVRRADESAVQNYKFADTLFGDEAVRVIQEHDPSDPLFLFVSWSSPHSPTMSPETFMTRNTRMADVLDLKKCEDAQRYEYAGMISALDEEHDKILKELASKGMADNTVIIFISDNGGHDSSFRIRGSLSCENGGPRYQKSGRNYPLRGGKFTFWEGGIRTQAIVYSPSSALVPAVRRGKEWDGLVSGSDWPATILELAGAPHRESFAPDSVSFWGPLAAGKPSQRTSITVQLFKDRNRFVILYTDPITGHLFKLMRGYPGYIRDYGWAHRDRWVAGNDPGDLVTIPEELREADPAFDADVIARGGLRHDCKDQDCLFDVTADQSELENLVRDEGHARVLKDILEHLESVKGGERPFPGSDLCYVGDRDAQEAMQHAEWTDPHAIAMARLCKTYVSWMDNDGVKLPLKEASCPDIQPRAPLVARPEGWQCKPAQSIAERRERRQFCKAQDGNCWFKKGACWSSTDCASYNLLRNENKRQRRCRRARTCSFDLDSKTCGPSDQT